MRILRIFGLHFEQCLEYRSRAFVWFLVSLFNPLLFILFWVGAFQGRHEIAPSWTMSSVTSYYFLLTMVAATLMSHTEDDIARFDIQEGELVRYLLKPFSYYWMKFFEELPYRLLQGFYAIVVLFLFYHFFGSLIVVSHDWTILLLSICICVFAFFLSHLFKMIIGLIAFWTTDILGIYNLVDITLLIFAGYIVPIQLFSPLLYRISVSLPFAYMIYYPVVAFQGKLNVAELFHILSIQGFWIAVFFLMYRFMWSRGLKEFCAVGQ